MKIQHFYIETFGCQMNVYDTELISGILEESGFKKTSNIENADAIFLNTCSVREKAEETVFNRLNNLKSLKRKNPGLLFGVLGCMAQSMKNELLESKPFVDIILGPDSYRRIPEIIKERSKTNGSIVDTKLSKFEFYDNLFPSRKEGVNAWIPIMRGCDKFCTFCIVPFTRGRERSRTIESIVKESKKSVEQGFVEITLLGQNVNSYRTSEGNFSELLLDVSNIPGVLRVRYTSPHPADINENLLQVMRDKQNICNHIHLPLQAGSSRILKRMNRTYTKKEFLKLVEIIRTYLPNCALSTDIIVGFPGETEEEFKETLEVVEKVGFDSAFMFKYSPRRGTKASEYTDQIEEPVKQNRLERLIELQKKMSLLANQNHVGKIMDVMVEKESKKSEHQWAGRTDGNIWVVFDKTDENVKDIVKVKIDDTQGVTLFGHRIKLD
ncbi:MAG: tRNA (N6-isopentenyl adenosine(37)-C2)-methylthiotransferase MiaB [Candidatus Marinimicrobia bacterium]|nr:tRNA (N6-isopentenyl adenosine(37)-C2)-methylthiotransferase MiaB [Candidatus Neomarinimicrobiota bacterium]MBL7022919.1 tRNA (N6-isopentenyl adenosine(37)-C2)-methylthiotransferase MiaB [Candidatus Neomarinimicrobiota bacterium]MBL7110122.1 tRNA (N6-isopentenyl adenosine(37)-C2)-methylthiotransferase MiaB [Candidatus Neomarinimicrobiota bacterium]